MMTLDELIRGIHDLGNYLKKFEEKYRLLSDDFYRLATAGKLEQSNDFIEWLGVYEIKLKREKNINSVSPRCWHDKKASCNCH